MMSMRSSCIDHGRQGNRDGYTMCKVGKATRLLHRVVYCNHSGKSWEDLQGLVVRHKCDNPRCINPDHLEIGTYQDNSNDMVTRGRSAKGLKHGRVKLTLEQVAYIRENYKPFCSVNGAKALGIKYGVSPTAIHLAHKGTNWKHII